jgi:hypothetical protein
MVADGGCLCGAVRYRLEGPPLHADYCHRRLCQRAAGAPVVAWGTWPADRFAWPRGEAGSFASSARGERSFRPGRGTPLAFVDPGDPTYVDVTLASLDDPAAFPPGCHAWTTSRVRWLEIGDGLPRHAGARSKARAAGHSFVMCWDGAYPLPHRGSPREQAGGRSEPPRPPRERGEGS